MSLASNIHELLLGGGATNPYSYTINNSLRWRASSTSYLSRTPASASNRQIFTWSGWVKIGYSSNGNMYLFSVNTNSGFNDAFGISLNAWRISIDGTASGSTTLSLISTQVLRDPSSWYHIVVSVDTTQATSSNRVKIYINGSQVTAFSTASYPTQNLSTYVNSTVGHYHGLLYYTSSTNFDGYMSEINFIDGQALDASYFGATNSITGTWAPKAYSGSYGTNGYYLNFSNTTSTTTLGYDYSGNGNNNGVNNFSLTAGSTYCAMMDSPTPKSSTVGNYCTLNPLDTGGGSVTVSGGNLDYSIASSTGSQIRGTVGSGLSGKYYWEYVNGTTASGGTPVMFGLSTTDGQITNNTTSLKKAVTIYTDGGSNYISTYYLNGSGTSINTQFRSASIGDIFQVAYDADTGKVWFGKNNTWYDGSNGTSGNPSSGTNPVFTIATGDPMTPFLANLGATYSGSLNCGQRPFAYTPPTGFKALQTYNLPTPAIKKGNQHFDATLYTGNGGIQTITGINFAPDFVWIKDRSAIKSHTLYNSVCGVEKVLLSNATDAEATITGSLTSFNSNGFSLGSSVYSNVNGDNFIGWQWKGGGTAVTNTNGSITSQVSANPSAGFSVVTYTGNGGTNGTASFGHGLGVKPDMVIIKSRSASSTNWVVEHSGISTGRCLLLNDTSAVSGSYPDQFQFALRTSSVYYVGSNGGGSQNNVNGNTYVAYCFAAIPGYSAFGSYVGNSSTDGVFIYTGFRPRWIMIKSSTGAYNWVIFDAMRLGYNYDATYLLANSSNAEGTDPAPGTGSWAIDILSNGFKNRDSAVTLNNSGQTYIYAAFAENPFQYSLAR